jgi:hypothetical protein
MGNVGAHGYLPPGGRLGMARFFWMGFFSLILSADCCRCCCCYSLFCVFLPALPCSHQYPTFTTLAFLRSRISLCPFAMVRAGRPTIERINLHRIKKWIPQLRFLSKSLLSPVPSLAMCRALHLFILPCPVAYTPAQQRMRKTDAVADNRQPGIPGRTRTNAATFTLVQVEATQHHISSFIPGLSIYVPTYSYL